jgi:Glycosyltransferase WbsX/Methyltransferase domain
MTLSNAGAVTFHVKKEPSTPRLIAFYLTQFHPTPENDLWWGKGFTEWTNVTKTQPLFEGHYQPHLPSDFGFYDLRVRETRHDQIKTAKQYGIDGFCYHYYWFSGKRILNAPLDDMLADPASDMPFCLCWANENWTRRWDAADHEILIAQKYAADDDLNFIKSLVPFFSDPRYIKVDGAPFLIVYRPQHLPDANKSVTIWRDYCTSIGIPKVHIACALTHGNYDYAQYGFDGGVEFPPHNLAGMPGFVDHKKLNFSQDFSGSVCQYSEIANLYLQRQYPAPNVFKTVFPSWDNTARTGARAFVTLNGTPANYEYWLSETILKSQKEHPGEDRLVFINAWNEWAEGCHLEPDRKYGHGFLEATRKAKSGHSEYRTFPDVQIPKHLTNAHANLAQHLSTFEPRRWVAPSNWLGHAPFVSWLIKISKPKLVVEIGTGKNGNAFCVMNQAIAENRLATQAHAFAWADAGDHTALKAYLGDQYPHATLTVCDKNAQNPANQFADGDIDILHFNNVTSAQQLRQLMQHWQPKLSRQAVVLIHNTNWHGADCDVHAYWDEVKSSAPSYHFLDSHGLGVLLAGADREKMLSAMDDEDSNDAIWLSKTTSFTKAGKQLEQRHRLDELKNQTEQLELEIQSIRKSKSWQLTAPIRKIVQMLK